MTLLFAAILTGFSFAVQDTIPPDLGTDILDPELGPGEEEFEEAEEDTVIIVHIWDYEPETAFDISETDSTLRWINMLNLTDRFAKRPGAITYRTGILSRPDGVDFHTFENRHYRAEVNGLQINDPLTGGVNWYRVPIHKIISLEEADYGPLHRTRIRTRDHYLTKPRTYLNFDESSHDYRHLEFVATHNVRPETNLELSFWDRRDGIGYNRSDIEGRQIFLQGYSQLNYNWLLKGGYINNRAEQEQSFGYVVSDPQLFDFNTFTAMPEQSIAESKEKSKDIYLQFHHRRDINEPVKSRFGLHYQTDERTIQYSADAVTDSIGTKFRNAELYASHREQIGNLEGTATARLFYLGEVLGNQLLEDRWTGVDTEADLLFNPFQSLFLSGSGRFMARNDDRITTELSGRAELLMFNRLLLSGFGGIASQAPDIQSLYWQSADFTGNPDLENEESLTAGAKAVLGFARYFSLGARGDFRDVINGVFVAPDGQFVNAENYRQLSGTGWLGLHSSLFEGEVSATYKTFETVASLNPVNQLLDQTGNRIWFKGNLYWKNYLFDNATFVKMGVNGIYSPDFYRTANYITPLNRWQHAVEDFYNPPFTRVDFEVSARIRWFMMLMKWENLFDGVTQRGYFETMGYPMPERRFIFSIRVLFTN